MTWRQLVVWLRHLPEDSATMRAFNEAPEWTLTNHLLAAVLDATAWGNWQRGMGKGPKPKPIPRPGVDDGSKRYGQQPATRSNDETRAILRSYTRGDFDEEGAVTDGD